MNLENDKLIIIIPTHNRHEYLNGVVEYYSHSPYNVVICDSSPSRFEMGIRDNINYYWLPDCNFYQKILYVLNNTDANYYVLTPDDDFLVFRTLDECYEKMLQNREYVLGAGRQCSFHKEFDGSFFESSVLNCLSGKRMEKKGMVNTWTLFNNYQNILWSLYDKRVLVKVFNILNDREVKNANLVELTLGIVSSIHGNIYLSDEYLNVREITMGDTWGRREVGLSIRNLIQNKNLRRDLNKVGSAFQKKDKICFYTSLVAFFLLNTRVTRKIKRTFLKTRNRGGIACNSSIYNDIVVILSKYRNI